MDQVDNNDNDCKGYDNDNIANNCYCDSDDNTIKNNDDKNYNVDNKNDSYNDHNDCNNCYYFDYCLEKTEKR